MCSCPSFSLYCPYISIFHYNLPVGNIIGSNITLIGFGIFEHLILNLRILPRKIILLLICLIKTIFVRLSNDISNVGLVLKHI